MNHQHDLKELEKELHSFPKLNLDEQKHYEIHQKLMFEASKIEARGRKGAIMKRLTVGFSSLAVIVLGVFLAFSLKENEVKDHGGEVVQPTPGQNNNQKENPFESILEGDIKKIVASSDTETGEMTEYITEDPEIIKVFQENMLSMPFEETEDTSSVFNSTFELYGVNDEVVLRMTFTGQNIVVVEGEKYKIDEEKLKAITDIFFTEEYKIVEEPVKDEETIVQEQADIIIKALAQQDMELLAEYVHSSKGLLFSPYIYVDSDALVFSPEEVKELLNDSSPKLWGTFDGSGEPMELSAEDYYNRFVFDKDYVNADEILLNPNSQRGNALNNVMEVFPNSYVVEYYVEGTEQYGGMDWRSLNLVFQQDENGEWKLVAIVHDEWTT